MITKLPRLRKKVFDDEGVRPSLFTQREIHEIVRRHGLTLLRSHERQDIHLVRAPAAARPEDFLSHVRSDHDVKGIEPDTDVMLPEAPAGLELDQSTASILDTLSHGTLDRKSTRLNSSHANISYAVFCLKKKNRYGQAYTSHNSI